MIKKRELIVTVAEEHLGRIHEIASQCRAAGMHVDHVLESTGTITGHANQSTSAKLGRMKAIRSVESAGEVNIGPPESKIQ